MSAPQEISASTVDKRYKDGLAYKKQLGFTEKWPEFERFKAGDQWPAATEKTKNLPRPVFNVIRYIQNHKVSSVMNENIRMLFTPQEIIDQNVQGMDQEIIQQVQLAQEGADKFTRYSETTWENIKQDELNEEALEIAANVGTGIWHYFWDTSKKGGLTTPYIGDMCGENIDPMNIFFGNPQQRRVQKQPYIIISSRDLVSSIREKAKANGVSVEDVQKITSDKETQDEGYDSAKVEINDDEKTTVLTMYWKKGEQVYFMKVASSVTIQKATPTGFTLYPIAVMQWERRRKSIYGVGDTEGLIPNQKAINFLLAMQLLSVQLTGWPKMVYNPNHVTPSQIMNIPGELVADRSPQGTEGIRYMNPGPVSPLARELVTMFIDYTKQLSSAQDAATGDMSKGNLNATAIMLLQKAAGVPIESIKKRFYRAMEDIGQIWEQFWKVKYNIRRRVNLKDDDGKEYSEDFTGSDYANINMSLKIDIGPASQFSEELMMASLDRLFDKGHLTIEDYLEFAPKNVVPFKDRLLKRMQERRAQQMQEQLNQVISTMTPEEQAAFQSATPEQQQAIIQQFAKNAISTTTAGHPRSSDCITGPPQSSGGPKVPTIAHEEE